MNIQDIPAGTSWACRFKTITFLDSEGLPLDAPNLALGQAHPGTPGVYTSIGVIQVRDLDNQRVQLQCTSTHKQFTVDFQDCWDIDSIEWIKE
jgi:hypothetical protein